jgi:hypothetical protein
MADYTRSTDVNADYLVTCDSVSAAMITIPNPCTTIVVGALDANNAILVSVDGIHTNESGCYIAGGDKEYFRHYNRVLESFKITALNTAASAYWSVVAHTPQMG